MGQTAHLRLIRDRFIAGHSSCELRRHLDSVPHETPIRDVVDRCRVWESHANPAVRRVSKPSPDPTYPAYVVGDADRTSETSRVAAVTGQRSALINWRIYFVGYLQPWNLRPDAGGACSGKVVTATGDGNTDIIRTDDALIPRGTAPTTATSTATATRPTRLE